MTKELHFEHRNDGMNSEETWDNEKNMTHKNHEISKNCDLNINLCILSARACSARPKDIETIFRKQNWQSSLFFRGSAR